MSASKFWWHLESSDEQGRELFGKIEKSLFGDQRELIVPWMLGKIKSEDVIQKISYNTNLDYKKIFDEFVTGCTTMAVSKKVLELISELRKRGIKVVIATDNMDSFTRWTYPGLRLFNYFDGYLNSHDLRAMKGSCDKNGNSLFFSDYFVSLGLKPGESVLIDDSEDRDGIITSFGIDYVRIEQAEVGLLAALRGML